MNWNNIGKKAMFLSLIALLLVMLFVFAISLQNVSVVPEKENVVRTRVKITDEYVKSLLDEYIPMAIDAAAYNAFDYVATHSWSVDYVSGTATTTIKSTESTNYDFIVSLIRGGMIGVDSDGDPVYDSDLRSQSLYNWFGDFKKNKKGKINTLGDRYLGSDTTIRFGEIKVTQQDPWHVNVTVDVNVSVDAGLARWNVSRVVERQISIAGLHDKLVVDELVKKDFNAKKSSTGFDPDTYDSASVIQTAPTIQLPSPINFNWKFSDDESIARLKSAKAKPNEIYVHNPNSTSYLQRLTGVYEQSSSCCGIVSIVSKDVCNDNDYSYVDYCYYNKFTKDDRACGPALLYCGGSMILSAQQAKYFNVDGKCSSELPASCSTPPNPSGP